MLPGSAMPVLSNGPISVLWMHPCMLCNTPPAAGMQKFCAGTSPAPPSPTKAAASGKKSSSTRVSAEDVDSDEDFLVGVDMTLLHR